MTGFKQMENRFRSFMAIAMWTGQREVCFNGGAAMFFGQDVIDLKRKRKSGLREEAILALLPSSFTNQPHQLARHC